MVFDCRDPLIPGLHLFNATWREGRQQLTASCIRALRARDLQEAEPVPPMARIPSGETDDVVVGRLSEHHRARRELAEPPWGDLRQEALNCEATPVGLCVLHCLVLQDARGIQPQGLPGQAVEAEQMRRRETARNVRRRVGPRPLHLEIVHPVN